MCKEVLFDEMVSANKKLLNSKNKYSYIVDSLLCERSKPIKDRDYDKITELRNEAAAVSAEFAERLVVCESIRKRYCEALKPSSRFIMLLKNIVMKLRNAI